MSCLTRRVYFILMYYTGWSFAIGKSSHVFIRHPLLKELETTKYFLKANSRRSNLKCGTEKTIVKDLVLLAYLKNTKGYTEPRKILAA